MAKYRKKPVEVEAFQILMHTMHNQDYPQWFADAIASGVVYQKANPNYPVECTIKTLEGEMDANLGDYVIKGVNGELYPCKQDIFNKTYERCCDDATMTSEEERVEVAESIRYYAKESDETAYEFIRGYWPNDLADLIDPTCHMVDTDHEYEDSIRCDVCQMTFNRPWEPFKYCPECGARVVSDDE